jgi:hypothetical protein
MADDIPGIAGKIGECLVVATVAEARRRKWSKWWPRRGKRKKHSFFFSTLVSYFSSLR